MTVVFTLTPPSGAATTQSATSGANGVASWSYKPTKTGTYRVTARATYAGQTVTSSEVTFNVN